MSRSDPVVVLCAVSLSDPVVLLSDLVVVLSDPVWLCCPTRAVSLSDPVFVYLLCFLLSDLWLFYCPTRCLTLLASLKTGVWL